MQLFVQVIGDAGTDGFFELDWPEHWRVPATGEWLLVDASVYVVELVQWELQGDASGVQLRVRRIS